VVVGRLRQPGQLSPAEDHDLAGLAEASHGIYQDDALSVLEQRQQVEPS
jgi:hypothetical protein